MLKEMLKEEYIFLNVDIKKNDKKVAIEKISELCSEYCEIPTKKLAKAFLKREALDSTGFGEGLAIPHAKIKGLKKPMVAICRFNEEIDWQSLDDAPVKLAIVLIMPDGDKDNLHLQVLAMFARRLVHEEFMKSLCSQDDAKIMYNYIISKMEENV